MKTADRYSEQTLKSFFVPPDEEVEAKPSPAEWPEGLPEPGFYPHVRYGDYSAWPAMNATALLYGLESMEHVKASLDGYMRRTSEALVFGSALHMRLLEPQLFADSYSRIGTCQATKGSGQRCTNLGTGTTPDGRWLCGVHSRNIETAPPGNVLPESDFLKLDAMAEKVKAHKVVRLIRQHGGFECSGTWKCEGVPFKFRLDKLVDVPSCPLTVIDVKTVAPGSITTEAFMQHAFRYNYHIRAALQMDAVERLKDEKPAFLWVAIEKEYPFSVNVIRCSPKTYKIGKWQYVNLVHQYKRCLETGEWPGVCDDIVDGDPPSYIDRQWSFLNDDH